MSQSSGSYCLSKDVFMCHANGHLVFLDLRQDEYISLDRAKSSTIAPAIRGWVTTDSAHCLPLEAQQSDTIDSIALPMLDAGLLTIDPTQGKSASPIDLPPPTEALVTNNTPRYGLQPLALSRFYLGCAHASAQMKWRSLSWTVHRVKRRKERYARQKFEFDKARELVDRFNTMRPFYPRPYLCLFDALALVEFLSRYGVYPTWVYGVKAEPFSAHCWVQEENFAFNEAVETVRDYSPIMTV